MPFFLFIDFFVYFFISMVFVFRMPPIDLERVGLEAAIHIMSA